LLLEKVELPLRLSTLTYLNFSNPEIVEEQLQRLVQAVKVRNEVKSLPRILFVENEDSWINIAKAILADYDIDEVRTSSEAILKLKSETHYDLILSNLNLTDVNEASGEEVLEYIRDNCPSIPRIVITGKPVRGPIHSTLFERYQITEFITKGEINVPELRQLVRKILMPFLTGTKELQTRKNEMLSDLRKKYDQSVGHLNEGLNALDIYEVRLRREVGQHQAEGLTRPDKNVLMQKRQEHKNKYDNLTSQILLASDTSTLDEIYNELHNEW
jgi:response regulator RpfG family c-di-GMP phosphodiesterase